MSVLANLFSGVCVTAGVIFFCAGTLGLLRFPDALTRLHALSKADNLGLGLVALGLLPRMPDAGSMLKLLAVSAGAALGRHGQPARCRLRRAAGAAPMSAAFDILLVLLILGLAHNVTAAHDALSAVVAFIGLGLLLALGWLRLRSVDVGLTEAAIGSGATGFLLLRAEAGLRAAAEPREEATPRLKALTAVACLGVAVLLGLVVFALPEPPPSLVAAAAERLPETGLGNPVTGVLLAFRSLDTLLETVVLLLALLGVWALAAEGAWGERPALRSGPVTGADAARADAPAHRPHLRRSRLLGRRERARRSVPGGDRAGSDGRAHRGRGPGRPAAHGSRRVACAAASRGRSCSSASASSALPSRMASSPSPRASPSRPSSSSRRG